MKMLTPAKSALGVLFALLFFAALFSAPAQAQSGYWVFDHYECAGTDSYFDGYGAHTVAWPVTVSNPNLILGCGNAVSLDHVVRSIGTVSAVFIWRGSSQESSSFSVLVDSSINAQSINGNIGPAPDDGFQDPPMVTTDTTNFYWTNFTSAGKHMIQVSNASHSITVHKTLCSLSGITGSPGLSVRIDLQAYVGNGGNLQAWSTHCAPALRGSDSNWDPMNPAYFSGTGCQATGNAVALSGTVSHAQLCIGENGSDTVVKEYFAPTTPGAVGAASVSLSALFDSTHFKDKAKIKVKLKVWDSNGGTYDTSVTAPTYNFAYVLANKGRPVPHTNPQQYIGDFDDNFGIYPDKPDMQVSSIRNHLESMKHTVEPSAVPATTSNAATIRANMHLFTVFYIWTHGASGVFGDCTTIANDQGDTGVYASQIASIVQGRDTQNTPPFNFVHVDGCATAGVEPNVSTTLADAFGVSTRKDAAFLGFLNTAYNDRNNQEVTQRVWQNLANQQSLLDAVKNSLRMGQPTNDGAIFDANNRPTTTKFKIIGDGRMRLHGIYSGVAGNWFKPL